MPHIYRDMKCGIYKQTFNIVNDILKAAGMIVRSTRFGDGWIIEFDDISMQIKVSFTKYGVRTFTVPMAFTNGYLKIV